MAAAELRQALEKVALTENSKHSSNENKTVKTVIAFDLYGTLLSTDSIVSTLREVLPAEQSHHATHIATQARRLQLEYSWRVTCMGTYTSFNELTRHSFRQAAREVGIRLTSENEEKIMEGYNGLTTFKDADLALKLLRDTPDAEPFIFSNGNEDMLQASLATSPALSASSSILPQERVISVAPLQLFKPHPKVYEYLVERSGLKSEERGNVWLVSSNPFDAMGAVAAGLKSAWVDRDGKGWGDGLSGALGVKPTVIARGVDGAVRDLLQMRSKH